MPQKTIIEGTNGTSADVVQANGHKGLVVSTIPGLKYTAASKIFRNDTYGVNINQDASASGTPDGIHNGTDTALWTASAITGTWDFASTAQAQAGTKSVDATATVDGDQALFTRSSAITSTDYSSVSGFIYITSYNQSGNEILLSFRLAGVNVGNSVDLANYVDTGNTNAWLKFVIPIADLNLSGNIDEMIIQTVRNSGQPPNYYLDTMQMEEAGTITYLVEPAKGERYEFNTVDLFMVDALSTTLTDGTMPSLSYDKLLNVSQLASGINLTLTLGGQTFFNATFRDLGDMLFAAFNITTAGSDGTNTFVKLSAALSDFVVLEYGNDDKVEITISDDLSGLLRFRANVRGRTLLNG